ncbi:hypothetical protein IWW36_003687 [Coemansia brasiliensis]|uniref:Uncharacterized protein n=1 Tax=Coemansia brasiliensis TaxID=2650707 RepID=A0A9W8I5Z8_9FUNG|nr:hypothetical protein IWW36_003687 [Coemansia brasiliensis]
MAPLLITATMADTTSVAATNSSVAAKHAMGISGMMGDDVDTTFSPLSSSTITIASLGSTLGLNVPGIGKHAAHKGTSKHALSKGSDIADSDNDEDASSSSSSKDGKQQSKHMRSYSSANISTAAESASSSHKSSVELSGMQQGGMRSVSVDHTRAYSGLQMVHKGAAAHESQESAVEKEPKAEPAQQSMDSTTRRPATAAGTVDIDAAVAGPGRKLHKSLKKRILAPLSFGKHGVGAGVSGGDKAQGIVDAKQSPDGSNDNGAALPKPREKNAEASMNHEGAPGTSSFAAVSAGKLYGSSSSNGEIVARNNGMPSKSLDIGRANEAAAVARGPLSRRMLQRTKHEDAIYSSSTDNAKGKSDVWGPARFRALSRSLVSRLGFASLLAERQRPGSLRFVIAPHPQMSEVLEVYDCEEMVPVYRKVSRSGKSWHETFHEVDLEAEEADKAAAMAAISYYHGDSNAGVISDYEMAMALGLPYPIGGASMGGYGSTAAASCVTFQSSSSSAVADNRRALRDTTVAMSRVQALARSSMPAARDSGIHSVTDSPLALSNQSTASFGNVPLNGTVRMGRGVTMGAISMYGASAFAGGSVPFDKGLLWEALTPYPNQFPLHVKDSRSVIDTVSLASMVLDRHNFCYRFQLGHNRMRWMAKRVRKHQLAMQCFVRSVLVAEVFVDYEKGYSPYNMPTVPSRQVDSGVTATGHVFGSNATSGISTPVETVDYDEDDDVVGTSDSTVCLPEDGSLPIVTILPVAFEQLSGLDPAIVESFIIFTGMQMLECLHI